MTHIEFFYFAGFFCSVLENSSTLGTLVLNIFGGDIQPSSLAVQDLDEKFVFCGPPFFRPKFKPKFFVFKNSVP